MKLASLRHGRDGKLIVVSSDLTRAVVVPEIAPTLQSALDRWSCVEPDLRKVAMRLEAGDCADVVSLDVAALAAPLPRAYQWADGSAYVNHVELVRKARGAELPARFWKEPLIYQGGSDVLLGPRDDVCVISEDWGIDVEGEVAVIVDDVPMSASPEDGAAAIRLVTLVNDVSLRNLIPGELEKGFGFFQSKPSSAFSPVAVTPDELGDAWDGRRLHRAMSVYINDQLLGAPEAGVDMVFDFADLIAHAARTRALSAGTIIGSGTISNLDRSKGTSCLAEKRMLEIIASGEAKTPFLRFGDRVRMEMLDESGGSIFGSIEQTVVAHMP